MSRNRTAEVVAEHAGGEAAEVEGHGLEGHHPVSHGRGPQRKVAQVGSHIQHQLPRRLVEQCSSEYVDDLGFPRVIVVDSTRDETIVQLRVVYVDPEFKGASSD